MDEQTLHQSIKQVIREMIAANNDTCPTPMALLIAMRQKFPHALPESYRDARQLVINLRNEVQKEAQP